MRLNLETLRLLRERTVEPAIADDELVRVHAMLDDIAAGLAAMPDVSAIEPATRFSVAPGARRNGGD